MDNATVIAAITLALQDMCTLAGVPSPMDQLTAATAALTAANTSLAALQTSDAALQAKLTTIKADLAKAVTDAG